MIKHRRAGRPDLQRRLEGVYAKIGARLDQVDEEFAEQTGDTFRRRIPQAAEEGQVDVLQSKDPGGDLGPRSGAVPEQMDLFAERGPGASAHRSIALTDPEGRSLIARFIAGVRTPGLSDRPLSPEEIVTVADSRRANRICLAVCIETNRLI